VTKSPGGILMTQIEAQEIIKEILSTTDKHHRKTIMKTALDRLKAKGYTDEESLIYMLECLLQIATGKEVPNA